MKKIYAFIVLAMFWMNINVVAQNGATCTTAIQENSNPSCVYSSYVINGTEMWLKFTAASEHVNIEVITTQFGSNAPHVHGITMYSGTCTNLVEIASDELAFFSSADRITIDLDASPLVVGNIYFIKLSREATDVACPRIDCFPVVSPASFVICIEEIDVFIPVDLQAESPAISHAYYQQRGQLLHTDGTPASEVKLYSIRSNPRVFIADEFTAFVFSSIDTNNATLDTLQRVDMTLVGANEGIRVFKTEKTKDVLHYYYPHITKGVTGNKGFSRAVCNDVYPFIDMQLYSNSHGLKLYFIVRPSEISPNSIRLKFDGADNVSVTGSGGLKIETSIGEMEFERAHVYRIHPTNNNLVPMPASGDFVDLGNNEFKFDIGNYPASWTLVIAVDEGHSLPAPAPSIGNLEWCSYFGGDGNDKTWAMTVDNAGRQYITGGTSSLGASFPTTPGTFQNFLSAWRDLFFSRFNKNHQLDYSTFYGGTDDVTEGYDIKTNSKDDVYIYGKCDATDAPTLQAPGAYFDATVGGLQDCFIMKFDSSFIAVRLWATYFGGPFIDIGTAMAIDAMDNVFITGGMRDGMPLVTPAGAYSQAYVGVFDNAFVAKFNDQDSLIWFTYHGDVELDLGLSLNVDGNNNVFVGGATYSPGFPTFATGNAYIDNTLDGLNDAFLLKFNNNGARLWATLIGGSDNDQVFNSVVGHNRIAFDNLNNVFFGGVTDSPDFPTLNPGGGAYFDGTYSADALPDGFVMEFKGSDLSLNWSTYLGDLGRDEVAGIWVDNTNRIFIVGYTGAQNFPNINFTGFYNQDSLAGAGAFGDDGFVVFMNSGKQIKWATFFGGYSTSPDQDRINDLIVFDDSLYVTGYTSAKGDTGNAKIPLVDIGGYYDSTYTGGAYDAFIALFSIETLTAIEEGEDVTTEGLLIYPNPANEYVIIMFETKANTKVTLRIHNVIGQKVYEATSKAYHGRNVFAVDMRKFASGVYAVSIDNRGNFVTGKLVKE